MGSEALTSSGVSLERFLLALSKTGFNMKLFEFYFKNYRVNDDRC